MPRADPRRKRCAIYTRKSSEEGLEQEFNSLLELQQTGKRVRIRAQLKPGTRLIREWRGRSYEVLVLDDGFSWHGRRYRSLSAIARQITGTAWSGPLFFGLRANGTAARPLSQTSTINQPVEGGDAAE